MPIDVEPDATLVPVKGASLLFIIPAYQREALSAICYRQQADCIKKIRDNGCAADALVIADDGNLDAAEETGHLTLEAPNQLGAKLNAGFAYAARNGYEYVCALGSDSWIHPDRFTWLPAQGGMLCTRNYVCLDATGERQGWFWVTYDGGLGSRVFHSALLADCGYAPVEPDRSSGCDTATLRSIRRQLEPAFIYTDLHPYELVGFQSDTQITPYERLVELFLEEWQQPFTGLADQYGTEAVDAIQRFYLKEHQ